MRTHKRGFTLIELLVVIAIIGVLAAILIPNLLAAFGTTKLAQTDMLINNISAALDEFAHRHPRGYYPADEGGDPWGTHLVVDALKAGEFYQFKDSDILETQEDRWELVDGWQLPMRYRSWKGKENKIGARNRNKFDLWSAGEDTEFETEDDVTNWAKIDDQE